MSGSRTEPTVTIRGVEVEARIDVEVNSVALRDNGWVPEDEIPEPIDLNPDVIAAVERWHIEQHSGAFLWCLEQPCEDVVKESGK